MRRFIAFCESKLAEAGKFSVADCAEIGCLALLSPGLRLRCEEARDIAANLEMACEDLWDSADIAAEAAAHCKSLRQKDREAAELLKQVKQFKCRDAEAYRQMVQINREVAAVLKLAKQYWRKSIEICKHAGSAPQVGCKAAEVLKKAQQVRARLLRHCSGRGKSGARLLRSCSRRSKSAHGRREIQACEAVQAGGPVHQLQAQKQVASLVSRLEKQSEAFRLLLRGNSPLWCCCVGAIDDDIFDDDGFVADDAVA